MLAGRTCRILARTCTQTKGLSDVSYRNDPQFLILTMIFYHIFDCKACGSSGIGKCGRMLLETFDRIWAYLKKSFCLLSVFRKYFVFDLEFHLIQCLNFLYSKVYPNLF